MDDDTYAVVDALTPLKQYDIIRNIKRLIFLRMGFAGAYFVGTWEECQDWIEQNT